MMQVFGTTPAVFIGLTVFLFGGTACLAGQALAAHWRASWLIVPYSLLLAGADRFLVYALFGGALDSLAGFLLDFAVLATAMGGAWRITRARKMVTQYPWLYQRRGLFGWRRRPV